MTRKTWLTIGGAAIGVVLLWYVAGLFASRVPVPAARAVQGPIREFIDEQAKTRLPETYLVTMPFAGRIEAIALTEGRRVKKDEVLARIVPGDLELDVKQATAAVRRLDASIRENADTSVEETAAKQAMEVDNSTRSMVEAAGERVKSGKAKLDYAKEYYRSVAASAATGAMSKLDLAAAVLQQLQSTYDSNQDNLVLAAMTAMRAATRLMPTLVREYIARKTLSGEVLEKQKAEAEIRLQQVFRDRQRGEMTSPVDGVVLSRFISNERFLAAGTSLLEIGRLEDLEVEAEILSLDVVAAKVGDPVEVYGPAVGRPPHAAPSRASIPPDSPRSARWGSSSNG
jgi:HlyD family secretion protein